MNQDIEAFIVRVWQEAENIQGRNDVWRGSIVHVGSNRQLYFYSLESIARFIRENINERTPGPPGESSGLLDSYKPNLFSRIYERIYQFGARIWRLHTQ